MLTNPALTVAPHSPDALSVIIPIGEHARDAPLHRMRLAIARDCELAHSVEERLPGLQDSRALLPQDFEVQQEHVSEAVSRLVAAGRDVMVLLERWASETHVLVLARSRPEAEAVLAEMLARNEPVLDDDVHALLWMMTPRGANAVPRVLQTEPLERLKANYPAQVRVELDRLAALSPGGEGGRLLLWHGPPGTGKTSAALGLLHAWRDWCEADVVTDPERMFTDPSYLLGVLARPTSGNRWKLVVCEDADEYLRADARSRSGPGLGRLLNATDGLLGRGSQAMVLLTTNDGLGRLHPAITRPGRCLSLTEFGPLSPQEASAWSGTPQGQEMTLAQLFALRAGADTRLEGPEKTGAYL